MENLTRAQREGLRAVAEKYVWWQTPDEALAWPQRVIAHIMNIGDYADMQRLAELLGDEILERVIAHAEAGQFDQRAWAYWHLRLGLSDVDEVPALPVRVFG